MQQISISNIPNQELSVNLDGNLFDIRIHLSNSDLVNNIMSFDILMNGNPIVLGFRAVAGSPIIPYKYLENGNFLVITMDDEYPDYTQFGITQFLIYASQSELEALRAST